MATSGLCGKQACRSQSGRRCGPRKFDVVSGGRWQQDACHPKAGKSRVWRTHLHFEQVACAVHLRTLARRSLRRAKRHSFEEGTKVILRFLTALQYNGQVGKITQEILNTYVPQTVNTIEVQKPKTIKRTETPMFQGKNQARDQRERMLTSCTTQ